MAFTGLATPKWQGLGIKQQNRFQGPWEAELSALGQGLQGFPVLTLMRLPLRCPGLYIPPSHRTQSGVHHPTRQPKFQAMLWFRPALYPSSSSLHQDQRPHQSSSGWGYQAPPYVLLVFRAQRAQMCINLNSVLFHN